MREVDYPPLHGSSNDASRSAQRWYLILTAAQLTLFALVSLGAAFVRLSEPDAQRKGFLWIGFALIGGLAVTFFVRERKFDRIWFDGRAVAESVKTLTWRYMMRSAPFPNDSAADGDAVKEIDLVRKWRVGIEEHIVVGGSAITPRMREVRSLPWMKRREFYLKYRAEEQRDWYTDKAKSNRRWKTIWYIAILLLQVLAAFFAFQAANSGPFAINITGVLMTVASGLAAWSQTKKHEELSNSYSLAAEELAILCDFVKLSTAEEQFVELVDQGEETVSREHTMWCARRSIPIRNLPIR